MTQIARIKDKSILEPARMPRSLPMAVLQRDVRLNLSTADGHRNGNDICVIPEIRGQNSDSLPYGYIALFSSKSDCDVFLRRDDMKPGFLDFPGDTGHVGGAPRHDQLICLGKLVLDHSQQVP